MLWNSVGTLFYYGCQWLLTVLVVHFKGGYSDAGVLSLAISISNPLFVAACLNLRNFQVSELEGRFSEGDFLVNRVLTSTASIVLCVCIVVCSKCSKYERLCIIGFVIFKVSEALVDVLHGMDQKVWRLDIAGRSFILRGFAILFSIAFGTVLGRSLGVTILCMILSTYLIIVCYDFRTCKRLIHPDFSYTRSNIVSLIKIGIPLAIYSLFLSLISTYPRMQLEAQYGKELLGIFASIATPTVLVTQLASFIFSPLMGIFAECKKEHDKSRLHRLLFIATGSTLVIGFLAIIMSEMLGGWILALLFGESIKAYSYLLTPIVFTAILTAIIWFLCGILTVFNDYYILAAFTFVSFLFCILSSPYLISGKQLMGAVLSLLISLIIELTLLLVRLIYLLKMKDLLI